jgi:hypothetical protein
MWKRIDNELFLQELKIGHIISQSSSQHENYQIIEIRENGIVTAAKTDATGSMIIFPGNDLVDANWWVMG